MALSSVSQTVVVQLKCYRCGQLSDYALGERVQRGCKRCCCDWFATADECPTVECVLLRAPVGPLP